LFSLIGLDVWMSAILLDLRAWIVRPRGLMLGSIDFGLKRDTVENLYSKPLLIFDSHLDSGN
jgi:hypothetical protein